LHDLAFPPRFEDEFVEAVIPAHDEYFGVRIAFLTFQKGWQLKRLAREARTSNNTIWAYTHDLVANPDPEIVERIARKLGVSIGYLRYGITGGDAHLAEGEERVKELHRARRNGGETDRGDDPDS